MAKSCQLVSRRWVVDQRSRVRSSSQAVEPEIGRKSTHTFDPHFRSTFRTLWLRVPFQKLNFKVTIIHRYLVRSHEKQKWATKKKERHFWVKKTTSKRFARRHSRASKAQGQNSHDYDNFTKRSGLSPVVWAGVATLQIAFQELGSLLSSAPRANRFQSCDKGSSSSGDDTHIHKNKKFVQPGKTSFTWGWSSDH